MQSKLTYQEKEDKKNDNRAVLTFFVPAVFAQGDTENFILVQTIPFIIQLDPTIK